MRAPTSRRRSSRRRLITNSCSSTSGPIGVRRATSFSHGSHTPQAASYLQANFHIVYVDIGRFDRNDDVVRKYGFVTSEGIPAMTVLASSGELIAVESGKAVDSISSGDDVVRLLSAWVDRTPTRDSALIRLPVQLDPAQIRTFAETLGVRRDKESGGTFVLQLNVARDSVTSAIVS